MTHDWITTLLALGFFAVTAAFFVMWSKLEEQKQKTAEAEERRWDEISRAVSLENEIAHWKEANDDKIGEILFYHAEYGKLESVANRSEIQRIQMQDRLSALQTELEQEKAYFEACRTGNHALQDKLSALLCPRNDHVWKDGVCVKCGRVKDD